MRNEKTMGMQQSGANRRQKAVIGVRNVLKSYMLQTLTVVFCAFLFFLSAEGSPKITRMTKKAVLKFPPNTYVSLLNFTQDGKYLISSAYTYSGAAEKTVFHIYSMDTFKRVKSYKENALPDRYKKSLPEEKYVVDMKNEYLVIQTTTPQAIVKKMKWSELGKNPMVSILMGHSRCHVF